MTALKKLRKFARPEPTLPKTNIVPLKGLMSPAVAPPSITLESFCSSGKLGNYTNF